MLDEITNNCQGQKSLTYEFSTLDKVASEEEDVKSNRRTRRKVKPM